MTDRELLELAAKAAGIGPVNFDRARRDWGWNPLTDDGDALRLAVKISADVCIDVIDHDTQRPIKSTAVYSETGSEIEPHGDDPCAATRRAIVRAAAEIGRRMQHE